LATAACAAVLGVAALLPGAGRPAASAAAQASPDSGAIRVHLLGHAIGSERYVIHPNDGALALTDSFDLVDRGGRVQLASTLRFTPAFDPLHLRSVGRTYRFVNVDADVVVRGKQARVRNLEDSVTI